MNLSGASAQWGARLASLALAVMLVALVYLVLAPFLAAIAWAAILAHVTWPAYLRLKAALGNRVNASAFLMAAGVAAGLVLPLISVLILVQADAVAAYRKAAVLLDGGAGSIADALIGIPWIGPALHDWLGAHLADVAGLKLQFVEWLKQASGLLLGLVGDMGRNIGKLALAVMTLFFFYRDGDAALAQVRFTLRRLLGWRADAYLATAGTMSRSIVQSVLLAALVQGAIAALGFWMFGVGAPVLFGVITAAASVIPMVGTFLVWGPIGLWLLLSGHPLQAVGMLAWGILLIHPVDNLLRSLLVSNATRAPILLVLFGVLGGIAAFGLIGLFLGPVILSVAAAIWREWVVSTGGKDTG
ncbi:AI-2E family transporter [Caenimonas terrae]|uniref:AI-2E family transporter n=1 Tax=Caenimonas terrae TaxID=696074 RepID=A0ABW0NGZ5_9BURK